MEEFDTETDYSDAGRDPRESARPIREVEDGDAPIDDLEEEWKFSDRKPGLASEAKAGLAVIVILVAAFAFLVYRKSDMRPKIDQHIANAKDSARRLTEKTINHVKRMRQPDDGFGGKDSFEPDDEQAPDQTEPFDESPYTPPDNSNIAHQQSTDDALNGFQRAASDPGFDTNPLDEPADDFASARNQLTDPVPNDDDLPFDPQADAFSARQASQNIAANDAGAAFDNDPTDGGTDSFPTENRIAGLPGTLDNESNDPFDAIGSADGAADASATPVENFQPDTGFSRGAAQLSDAASNATTDEENSLFGGDAPAETNREGSISATANSDFNEPADFDQPADFDPFEEPETGSDPGQGGLDRQIADLENTPPDTLDTLINRATNKPVTRPEPGEFANDDRSGNTPFDEAPPMDDARGFGEPDDASPTSPFGDVADSKPAADFEATPFNDVAAPTDAFDENVAVEGTPIPMDDELPNDFPTDASPFGDPAPVANRTDSSKDKDNGLFFERTGKPPESTPSSAKDTAALRNDIIDNALDNSRKPATSGVVDGNDGFRPTRAQRDAGTVAKTTINHRAFGHDDTLPAAAASNSVFSDEFPDGTDRDAAEKETPVVSRNAQSPPQYRANPIRAGIERVSGSTGFSRRANLSRDHGASRFGVATNASATRTGDSYVVRDGDNYWQISSRVYGSSRYYMALARLNRTRVPDPRRLKPGLVIHTPSVETLRQNFPELFRTESSVVGSPSSTKRRVKNSPREGFFVSKSGTAMYRVGRTDTLGSIAQKHLGRATEWKRIFVLNRQRLPNPNKLKPGLVLVLPDDASDVRTLR